ncbi:MARVEL domain-containing protein 3 [Gadus macrocephalus]|uniref:MARVEL domain-containing protein 3 n=1 Tax=Gadus macrocephalus TaxID=80720 RepID=UPI0028CB73E6|nr:MARVEL domain-containing protein 3 [Gadus macrocephalus]XP_059923584.1 MARVEL domain-containing protein 3 [Gadus macrocephalus]
MSHQPRNKRGHRDRNGERRENRASNDRYPEDDRQPSPDRSSRPPYYPAQDRPETSHARDRGARDVPREIPKESTCSHICSRRGIVLMCSVLTNALVLICVVAAQMVMSGLTSNGGLGGFNINSNFNLQGTELQQVRDLDMQYSQMRAPGIYGGLAFSLVFGVGSLVFAVSGNKAPHHLPRKTLYAALVFQAVGAVAYVVAVGLYLHFVIGVNATDVCQKRERLYARNGYTWMNCDVGGADAAVAMFGLITAILYAVGTWLTFTTIRGVRRYHQDRKRHEAGRREERSQPPTRADTTMV